MSLTLSSYIYGSLLAAGGIMGAAKGSQASLIAAGSSAALIMGLEYFGKGNIYTLFTQLLISAGLAYTMYGRFSSSKKFMPAGMVATLSFTMACIYFYRLYSSAGAGGQRVKAN